MLQPFVFSVVLNDRFRPLVQRKVCQKMKTKQNTCAAALSVSLSYTPCSLVLSHTVVKATGQGYSSFPNMPAYLCTIAECMWAAVNKVRDVI